MVVAQFLRWIDTAKVSERAAAAAGGERECDGEDENKGAGGGQR